MQDVLRSWLRRPQRSRSSILLMLRDAVNDRCARVGWTFSELACRVYRTWQHSCGSRIHARACRLAYALPSFQGWLIPGWLLRSGRICQQFSTSRCFPNRPSSAQLTERTIRVSVPILVRQDRSAFARLIADHVSTFELIRACDMRLTLYRLPIHCRYWELVPI